MQSVPPKPPVMGPLDERKVLYQKNAEGGWVDENNINSPQTLDSVSMIIKQF